MMQFCKEFNDRTATVRPDVPMRVLLKAYEDRSFTFIVKPPPTSFFLKKAAGILKGSSTPGHKKCGRVSIKYIYEIAKVKKETDSHLFNHDLPGIVMMIVGSCQAMGLEVVEDTLPPKKVKIDL